MGLSVISDRKNREYNTHECDFIRQQFSYEESVDGRVHIVNKNGDIEVSLLTVIHITSSSAACR